MWTSINIKLCLSDHVNVPLQVMEMRRRMSACPPVPTMSCTLWLCSGRFCLLVCRPLSTGMVGPASWSPSVSLASSLPSSGTWPPTSAAPWGCETPSLLWCLWPWAPLYRVRTMVFFYLERFSNVLVFIHFDFLLIERKGKLTDTPTCSMVMAVPRFLQKKLNPICLFYLLVRFLLFLEVSLWR